jgi:telomerase reverse transcriptase
VLPEIAFSLQKESIINVRGPSSANGKQSKYFMETRTPARVLFVRNRILYARAALNTQGSVRYGFRHIRMLYGILIYVLPAYNLDVLNRYRYKAQKHDQKAAQHRGQEKSENLEKPSDQDDQSTIHVMMYIFPREFGLHNVFTSSVDPRETVQQLKDYTLREEEIASKSGVTSKQNTGSKIRVPRRLRGKALKLVRKLRMSHTLCSYNKLLNHYCPSPVSPYVLLMNSADQSGPLPERLSDGNTAKYI